MFKSFAIGLQSEWDLLSAGEQSFYEDHYETLTLFASAKSGVVDTSSGDYVVTWLGDSPIESIDSVTFNMNLGGNSLVLDLENKTVIRHTGTSHCIRFTSSDLNLKFVLKNGLSVFTVPTGGTSSALIWSSVESPGLCNILISNIELDVDSKNGELVLLAGNGSVLELFNNKVLNSTRGLLRVLAGSPVAIVENNCVINASIVGIYSGNGDVTINSNYIDAALGYSGAFTSGGGNVSSDGTSPEAANRNISPALAFVDLVYFIPTNLLKIGVAPTISENNVSGNGQARVVPYYVGVNRPIVEIIINSRRRKRLKKVKYVAMEVV